MSRQPPDYMDIVAAANQPTLATSPAHFQRTVSHPDSALTHSPPTHDAGALDTPAPRRNAPVPMSIPPPAAVKTSPSRQERNFKCKHHTNGLEVTLVH